MTSSIYAENPLYVNAMTFIPELPHRFFNYFSAHVIPTFHATLEEYRELPALRPIVQAYGQPLTLYEIDESKKAIWIHLGMLRPICDEYEIPFPGAKKRQHCQEYQASIRKFMQENYDEQTLQTASAMIEKMREDLPFNKQNQNTLLSLFVIAEVINMEHYLFGLKVPE